MPRMERSSSPAGQARRTIPSSTSSGSGSTWKRKRIITTTIEHPSIIETVTHLKEIGYAVDLCPVDNTGRVVLSQMEALLGDDVALVSVMLGNNEIGTIQPVKEIAALAHRHGAYVHSDATQAIGKIEVSMKELDVDYLSLSAHKFYGPKASGFCAERSPLPSSWRSSRTARAGTYNNTVSSAGTAARSQVSPENNGWACARC